MPRVVDFLVRWVLRMAISTSLPAAGKSLRILNL